MKYFKYLLLGILFIPSFSFASTLVLENFETYSNGVNLNGLSNSYVTWTATSAIVSGTAKHNGNYGATKSLMHLTFNQPISVSSATSTFSFYVKELDSSVASICFNYNSVGIIFESFSATIELDADCSNAGGMVNIGNDNGNFNNIIISVGPSGTSASLNGGSTYWISSHPSTLSTLDWSGGGLQYFDDFEQLNTDLPPSNLSGNYFTNLSPYYGSTTSTNLVSLSFDFYNTGYAYPNWDQVCAYMLNLESGAFQTANEDIRCFDLVATGINSFATTTTLSEGLTQIILYQFDSVTGERALATTSRFIVKQSFLNIQGVPQFEATTTILQDCSTYSWLTDSTKRLGCEVTNGFTTTIRYMFYPSDSVLDNYKKLKDDYANKPPFGYVNAITSVFNSATTTATSTTETFFDTSYLSSIFTPLRVGLASILFLLFGVYIFKRFSNFQL